MTDKESLLDENDPLLTPKAAVEDLRRVGLRISSSWYEKLSQAGEGPPVDGRWGRTPMVKRSTLRRWAAERMQTEAG